MNNFSRRGVGGGNQHVLDYLKRMRVESPGFYYAIEGGNESLNGNIFWADSTSRINYNYFGDTVRFDTSYHAGGYKVPFATFTGVNHHAQPVLFGCALLNNESEASLVWVLQTWLRAMHSKAPVSITTDVDRLIQMVVTHVLSDTRHRFCRWSVFRQTKENVAHTYQMHPSFDMELKKCVNDAESIEEFESCWELIMEKYYVTDNEWLQSMYSIRHQWVPVFMRDTFFGELPTSDGDNVRNSYFDGFVDSSTTIQVWIKQYEKAMTNWHQRELNADLDTSSSTLLKTPSPMEKQAANLFTRRIFLKFQEELVETLANQATKIDDSENIATYRVAKFGEEHKAHTVRFNGFEMKSTCSCQMFEFSGLICRHTLSVFREKNVLTLPSQYILNRWTRNAKNGDQGALEECPTLPAHSQVSTTFRYNNLRHEAMKFVEGGAKSVHMYNVAMNALQDAVKKVSDTKTKNFGSINGRLESGGRETQAISQLKAEKERKIRELKAELDAVNHQSEVYRSNLLTVLKDMEDEKLKLSVKVQNARLSLKE
ncbi:hypothetical protein Leryth_004542 [Lithospermum erythrorhizon]|nr:hypothetical protein Leryth_004542 [Lithospermum erythrorhizon]